MFDPVSVVNFTYTAYTPSEAPEFLGSYPILQFFGGLSIVATAVLAFVWGDRKRRKSPVNPDDDLRDVIADFSQQLNHVRDLFMQTDTSLREDVAKQLSESRRVMYERTENIAKVVNDFMRDSTEKIHQLELTIANRLPRRHGHGEER